MIKIDKVGITCNEDHRIFSYLPIYLEKYDVETQFYNPEKIVPDDELKDLDMLIGQTSMKEVYDSLSKAKKSGIKTYISPQTRLATDWNPYTYELLSNAGYRVPEWSYEDNFEGKVVKKPVGEWMQTEPELIEEGGSEENFIYQKFIPNNGWDYKLYGVRTNGDQRTWGLVTPTKLNNGNGLRRQIELSDDMTQDIENIMDLFDSPAMGVDIIKNNGKKYVVDVNAMPAYTGVSDALDEISKSIHDML